MDSPADDEVRRSLDVILRIAELLLRSGSGTAEVESSVLATAAALGLRDEAVELDITLSSVVLGYAPEDEPAIALVRVVRGGGRDYARMSAVHAFVSDLAGGRVSRQEVTTRLEQVEAAPRPYGRWWVTIAWGGLAAAVTVRLGGGVLAAATSFLVTVAVDRCGRSLSRRGVSPFFLTLVGAALATAFAALLFAVAPSLPWISADALPSTALVVAGGIVVLLPGIGFVASVQDGIRGFPVTAVGRLFQVLLLTGAIIAGVVLVLDAARRLGVPVIIGNPTESSVLVDATVRIPAAAVGSACAALAMRTPPRLLVPAAAVGSAGFTVFTLAERTGFPAPVATAAAAVVIGAAGRVWALRRRAAPLAVVVPAITMLLPGLVIFEALRELTFGQSTQGLLTLLEAATIAVSLGAGAVLGDQLAQPVERGLDTVGDRRRRHR
jgi:uncharacterized membrane protein YjjP (DUF1212 family)